tara:strand:- start:5769 stop:6266 length:498 start_codon:yes stop_codon:yes gene_type:complete
MAWQDDMVTMLRTIVDDSGSNPMYSDSRLEEVIVVAANLMKKDVDFSSDYTISIGEVSIAPDPTTGNDYAFVNLVTLKAACLLANSEYKTEANNAISIRDGSASIDKRGVAAAKKDWRDSICGDYARAEKEYKLGNSNAGASIIGPYNLHNNRGRSANHRNRPTI